MGHKLIIIKHSLIVSNFHKSFHELNNIVSEELAVWLFGSKRVFVVTLFWKSCNDFCHSWRLRFCFCVVFLDLSYATTAPEQQIDKIGNCSRRGVFILFEPLTRLFLYVWLWVRKRWKNCIFHISRSSLGRSGRDLSLRLFCALNGLFLMACSASFCQMCFYFVLWIQFLVVDAFVYTCSAGHSDKKAY